MARHDGKSKDSDRLYTRTEARALAGVPDNHTFREYAAMGILAPRRLANGIWLLTRADIQAVRNERRRRGLSVPVVPGFE